MRRLFTLVALVALSSNAFAGTVSQSVDFPLVDGDCADRLTFDFAKFDLASCTLQSVTVVIDATVEQAVAVENRSKNTAAVTLTWTISYAVSALGQSDLLGLTASSVVWQPLDAFDGSNFLGFDSYSTTFNAVKTTTSIFTDPSLLALFTGTGTVSVPFNIRTISSMLISPSAVASDSSLSAQANTTIIYGYTVDIPEPATIFVLGLGALLFRKLN